MNAIDLLHPGLAGAVVGVALGLTGGGGSIFALPLLVHFLNIGVRDSVSISLATVGASSLFGALLNRRAVHWNVALTFSAAGIVSAPLGAWVGRGLPERATLIAFAVLMAVAGLRMWRPSRQQENPTEPSLRRPNRKRLLFGGVLTGLLAGIFGVGGGFIVVPVLVLGGGLPMREAIATSLLAIAAISASALVSQGFTRLGVIAPVVLLGFTGGALVGMIVGTALRTSLSEIILRRTFALGMWGVAATLLITR